MKKFTKLALVALVLATTATLISGCEESSTQAPKPAGSYVNEDIEVYCDKNTNVEYLVYTQYRSGGMTVRYNLDGTIKSCK